MEIFPAQTVRAAAEGPWLALYTSLASTGKTVLFHTTMLCAGGKSGGGVLWTVQIKERDEQKEVMFFWKVMAITNYLIGAEKFGPWRKTRYQNSRSVNAGVLISPEPDLLPDAFCLMVGIFRLMLILFYIYIYIYIYTCIVLIFFQLWL